MSRVVRIIGAADGVTRTPHDGRYVLAWNWDVEFGTLAITSTADIAKARRFEGGAELVEWRRISHVQPRRYDGKPNRPLTAVTIESFDPEKS